MRFVLILLAVMPEFKFCRQKQRAAALINAQQGKALQEGKRGSN
jgi:hypothetical protein